MQPILIVKWQDTVLQLQVEDLTSGLTQVFSMLHLDEQLLPQSLLKPLTSDTMRLVRELYPELKITAHYLTLSDSRILDGH